MPTAKLNASINCHAVITKAVAAADFSKNEKIYRNILTAMQIVSRSRADHGDWKFTSRFHKRAS